MSPYLIIYAFLLVLATVSFVKKKDYNVLLMISAVILTLFLVLRYGQGTDYFSYMVLYEQAPGGITPIKNFWAQNGNIEYGWKLLEVAFQAIRAPFWVFMGAIGIVSMLLLVRFAVKCCPGARMFALLLAYPTLYMSYLFSGVRQGLVICAFLGLMLPFLLEKKYLQYFAVGIVCFFFHKASFIVLAVPIVLFLSQKVIWWILGGCTVSGMVLSVPFICELLGKLSKSIGKDYTFYGIKDISWVAVAERLVTFGVIAFIYYKYQRVNKNHDKDNDKPAEILFKIYCYGLGIYLLMISSPLFASRMMFPLKMVEIVLAAMFIVKMPKWRYPVFLFFVVLTAAMTWKNIGSYIDQGIYSCKVINYPYVTVLQDKQTIFAWRDPEVIGVTLKKPKLAKAIGVPKQYWPEEPKETEDFKESRY